MSRSRGRVRYKLSVVARARRPQGIREWVLVMSLVTGISSTLTFVARLFTSARSVAVEFVRSEAGRVVHDSLQVLRDDK